MHSRDEKESSKVVTQEPTLDTKAEIEELLNRPNPRYGGRTPMELVRRLLNTRERKKLGE